ncbi:MAG: hypothetical protein ACYDAQ_01215 [Mycobacteriales bacterium]
MTTAGGEQAAPARRGRTVLGTRLFLVSYVPLWIIFAVRSDRTLVTVVFGVLAGLGFLDAFRIIEAGLRRSVRHVTFTEISDKSGDAAGYLATYLLPFIGGPPTDVREAVAYAVYFVVAWTVFVPSSLGLINPTLYLLGWRIVEATRNGGTVLIVCQDRPAPGPPGAPVAQLASQIGWIQRPTRKPWTWVARRTPPESS